MGTLLFNRNTYDAMQAGLDASSYDRLVWTPDVLGSICFLIASYLAYAQACGGFVRRRGATRVGDGCAQPHAGSVAFGIAAIAAYWVPTSGSVLDLAAANGFTALGGLCFLIGALLLLPRGAGSPQSDDASSRIALNLAAESFRSIARRRAAGVFLAVGCGATTTAVAACTQHDRVGARALLRDQRLDQLDLVGHRFAPGDNLSEEGLKSAADDVESATDTFVEDVQGLGAPDTEAGQKAKESVDQLGDELDSELAKIERSRRSLRCERCPRRRLDNQRNALDDESTDRLHLLRARAN